MMLFAGGIPMSLQIARRLFTIDEYEQMIVTGILNENDRIELVNGELIEMSPIGSHHAAIVDRLTDWSTRSGQHAKIVRVQSPIRVAGDSLPEPDIVLLERREDFYADAHPGPEDVLLVIEVADTSLEYDRTMKLPLYAEASIAEVWLINVNAGCIDSYSIPTAGEYRVRKRYMAQDTITPQLLPDLSTTVQDILG